MEPNATSSGDADDVGAAVGVGGVVGGGALEAGRRGRSILLSERGLGAALTAGGRGGGSSGETINASVCSGGWM